MLQMFLASTNTSHLIPPGPGLVLDINKIILQFGDLLKQSKTQEPRDWMRDTEQKRVISFWFSRQNLDEI